MVSQNVKITIYLFIYYFKKCDGTSGVARAFPGGRVAHPESQNEEEDEKSLRKNKKK